MDNDSLTPLYKALDSQTIRLFRMKTDLQFKQAFHNLLFHIARILFETWIPSWFLPKQTIEGELETFPLAEAPPYYALSYVWGDSRVTEAIRIGEHSVQVTTNLLAALRRLHLDYDDEYFWIDAICINQKDDEEKSEQVPMMGDIYKGAQTVVMWLGEEQRYTARAFFIIRKCSATMNHWNDFFVPTLNDSWNSKAVEFLLKQSRWLGRKKSQHALSSLFKNPYWERVWILQEVANSNGAVILSGRHSLDFFDLAMASSLWLLSSAMSYQHTGADALDESGALEIFEAFRTVTMGTPDRDAKLNHSLETSGIDNLRTGIARAGWKTFVPPNEDIFEMYERTRRFKATDSRDRFYALLNLLPADKVVIKPNYRMPVDEVHRTLVVEGIRSTRSLSCISFGGIGIYAGESPTTTRPSWIPDFVRLGDSNLPRAITICTREFGGKQAANACGARTPVYSISQDMAHLHAKGFICDTVESIVQSSVQLMFLEQIATFLGVYNLKVGQDMEMTWKLFKVLSPLDLSWAQNSDLTSVQDPKTTDAQLQEGSNVLASGFIYFLGLLSYKNDFQAKIAAIEKTRWLSMGDMDQARIAWAEGNPALSYFYLAANSSRQFWAQDRDLLENLYQQACQVIEYFPDSPTAKRPELIDWRISGGLSWKVAAVRFLKLAGTTWSNRSFVVTSEGYLGFARPGAQVGDKVCILHGCSVPLILRPIGDEYILVGDSYFQGMMRGEMLEKQEAGLFRLETLAIK